MLDFNLSDHHRVRLTRQNETAECGLASLTMVANYHGLNIDLATMRRRFPPSLRGTTLRALMISADDLGMIPRAVKLPLDRISNLHLPAILHWDMNHYVVLEQTKRDRAYIHNPDGRSKWLTQEEISNHFTGVALELRPSEDFETGDFRQRLKLFQLWKKMVGAKRAIIQIFALSILMQIFAVISPYYMQIAIDNAIPSLDLDLMTVLALGFGLFILIGSGVSALRSMALLSVGTNLGFSLSSNIARRLFRLPIDWFEKRHTGDILSRFQSVAPIQNLLTQGGVAAIVDGLMVIFTLTMMLFYDLILTSISILSFLFYVAVRIICFSFEKEAKEAAIVAGGKEQTTLIETLRGMTTLRLHGQETFRHVLWQNRLSEAIGANVRGAKIGIVQSSINSVIFGIENIISIWLSVKFVISGNGFSIGMIFAFMAYKMQFSQKASSLIDQIISIKMLRLHLDRISDIALSPEDRSFSKLDISSLGLIGKIELKNVSYRYSPTDNIVIDNVNIIINEGEHVAITGPSGEGKSTLIKIIVGLIEPTSGDVFIDNVPISKFGYRNYHKQISAVLQSDNLFEWSLAENIASFDSDIDMDRVILSALSASIHGDIEKMPMKYDTLVGEMGSSLSGGQKQRVLLARALYRRPRVLVMDEGTAHLDMGHEYAINAEIAKMGITRIIVAHRRETVETADRVLVMANGGIFERNKEIA